MSIRIFLLSLPFIFYLNHQVYSQPNPQDKILKISKKNLSGEFNNAVINFYTTPKEAKIIINDSLYGISPLEKVFLQNGHHKIEIVHPEYIPVYKEIEVDHYEYTLTAELEGKYGYIFFPDKSLKVRIDCSDVDIENKVKVEYGKRQFAVFDIKDSSVVNEKYYVRGNHDLTVSVKKNQFSIRNLLLSVVVPGLGQISDGSYLEGLGFFIPLVTSVGIYIDATASYNDQFENYKKLSEDYSRSSTELQLQGTKLKVIEAQNELNNIANREKIFGWISAGIFVLNLVDTALFHTFEDRLEFISRPVIPNVNHTGYLINVNIKL